MLGCKYKGGMIRMVMVNVLSLKIGDKVKVFVGDGGIKGIVVGFYPIVKTRKYCFEMGDCSPGIYRDPALAKVKIIDNEGNYKIIDVYYNNLKLVDPERHNQHFLGEGIISSLPETLFEVGDEVCIRSSLYKEMCDHLSLVGEKLDIRRKRNPPVEIGENPDINQREFFVTAVECCLGKYYLGVTENEMTYWNVKYHIFPEEVEKDGYTIIVKGGDIKLVERGEIYKYYNK